MKKDILFPCLQVKKLVEWSRSQPVSGRRKIENWLHVCQFYLNKTENLVPSDERACALNH